VIVPVLSSSKVSTSPLPRPRVRHRQHIEAHQAIHAGDANRRQSAPIVVGSGSRTAPPVPEWKAAPGRRQARDRRDGEDEYDRHAGKQDVEGDLFGVFCVGAFDQRDHAVEKGRAGGRVMRTLIQSEMTSVPPVTAERSPPLSGLPARFHR